MWADLRYALDELDRPSRDIHGRLTEAAELESQSEDEFFNRLYIIGALSIAYSKARMRADTRNAHEAIEKGLKAILLDSGLSEHQVRSSGHELHRLLLDVRQHSPTAFTELERCFNSTIQYLESVTTIRHDTNIVDYFQKHGKAQIFVESRYESIEGRGNTDGGMIGRVYHEVLRALLSRIFDVAPTDINSRIEEEARRAVLAESRLEPMWDAAEWLQQGAVRPRLEIIENLDGNRVLRAAVRKCARESKDSGIRYWAERLRRKRTTAWRKA